MDSNELFDVSIISDIINDYRGRFPTGNMLIRMSYRCNYSELHDEMLNNE